MPGPLKLAVLLSLPLLASGCLAGAAVGAAGAVVGATVGAAGNVIEAGVDVATPGDGEEDDKADK